MMARNLPVFNARCYNLQTHSGVSGLFFSTGEERYDSFRLSIGSLSSHMVSSENHSGPCGI